MQTNNTCKQLVWALLVATPMILWIIFFCNYTTQHTEFLLISYYQVSKEGILHLSITAAPASGNDSLTSLIVHNIKPKTQNILFKVSKRHPISNYPLYCYYFRNKQNPTSLKIPQTRIGSEYWRRVETRLWPSIIDNMEGQHRGLQSPPILTSYTGLRDENSYCC